MVAYGRSVAGDARVALRPIGDADIGRVAHFLSSNLNSRGGPETWTAAMTPPWNSPQPNHGFLLEQGGEIVGAHLAIYADRTIDGRTTRLCNLAAWCVRETHRNHGIRLLRALLGQPDYHFTDLSPSGNVVPLNLRLRFAVLDTATALVPNLPLPRLGRRAVRITSDPKQIAEQLDGDDLEIYRDHASAAAARHLVLVAGTERCYVMFRRERRKRLPLFASFIYVSNPTLFRSAAKHVHSHLLLRHRIPFTLSELRVVGSRPSISYMLRSPRPRMYRSPTLRPDQIDYLYSELACVAW
jgi:hypothetical protein